jgi:transposase
MNQKIIHIGLDVDDNAFHGCAFDRETGELRNFKCRPTAKGLSHQLDKIQEQYPQDRLQICYEATYLGFSLQRDLTKLGYHCEVICPNSIPRIRGNRIKTDRIDGEKLAQFYANGQLTVVDAPDAEQEKDRDLLRSRQRVLQQLAEMRSHIQSLLRRNGIHYKAETGNKAHWTKHHYGWLERKAQSLQGSLGRTLDLLLQQLKWLDYTIDEFNKTIDEMAASEKYRAQVKALTCYKGIKNIFALTIITEIGDIKRFTHPRKLVSFMGLDIAEYSSGGVHHRFGITKHGNRHLRTALVEANQRSYMSAFIGKDLKMRRRDTDPKLIHIADRCMKRLAKKGRRLILAGKHPNKVKVACAREMVGFVWESLRTMAA